MQSPGQIDARLPMPATAAKVIEKKRSIVLATSVGTFERRFREPNG
jgi:hypothetical protein